MYLHPRGPFLSFSLFLSFFSSPSCLSVPFYDRCLSGSSPWKSRRTMCVPLSPASVPCASLAGASDGIGLIRPSLVTSGHGGFVLPLLATPMHRPAPCLVQCSSLYLQSLLLLSSLPSVSVSRYRSCFHPFVPSALVSVAVSLVSASPPCASLPV